MKVIISPAKTFNERTSLYIKGEEPLFKVKSEELRRKIRNISKNEYIKRFNISKNQVNDIYELNNSSLGNDIPAIKLYNGFVFKKIMIESYSEEELIYLNSNVIILSALYGILKPFSLISPYRLDMKSKIDQNLQAYWEEEINKFLTGEIINLASDEFSSLITRKVINIKFLEQKGEDFINVATYSKQARGLFLNFMVKCKLSEKAQFKNFNEDGYNYNHNLSNENNYIFTRKK